MKYYVVFFSLIYFTSGIFGQRKCKIEGFVKDSIDKPIPFASVIIKTQNPEKIIAFTNTDAKGYYHLEVSLVESLSYLLFIQSLGFQKYTYVLNALSNPIFQHNITLKYKSMLLNEVIVNSKSNGVTEKKDTTEYLVKKFVETRRESVEDILKKMPFIEVSENGDIRFKGKKVEKILIDGDDLFDSNYAIGTRSLKGNILDKIQAIEHYSENKVLKGIENSDKIAINLVVKEENKKGLTGSVEVTSDFQKRHLGTLNGISYIKKFKGFFVGNMNNIGNDPASISNLVKSENSPSTTFNSNNPLYIEPNTIPISNIKSERIVDSDLKIGAFNFINHWSKKLVSKGFFYGFNHRGLSQMSHQENYSLFRDSFKIGEDRESNQLLQNNTFQHEFLFTPNEKTIIKHLSFVNVSSPQNNFQSIISNKEVFFVKESLQGPSNTMGQMLQLTTRLNKYQAFLAEIKYQQKKLQQHYRIPFNLAFQEKLNVNKSFDNINQLVDSQNEEISFSAKLVGVNAHSNKYKAEIGYNTQNQSLNTGLSLTDSSSSTSIQKPFQNTQDIIESNLFVNTDFQYLINNTIISFDINASVFRQSLKNENGIQSFNQFFISPSILLSSKFDQSNLLFTYKYSPKNPTINNFYSNHILSNYRGFQSGLQDLTRWQNHLVFLNFSNFNLYNNFKYSLSSILSYQGNSLSSNNQISQEITSSNITLANQGTLFYNFLGNIEKYIPAILLNLKSRISVSNSNIPSQLNGIARNITSQNKTLQLEILSVFDGFFNIDLSLQYSIDKLMINSDFYNFQRSNNTFSFHERMKLRFSPSLKGYLRGEQYIVSNGNSTNTNQIFDFQCTYTPLKSKISLSLDVKNILDTNNYNLQSISDYSTSQTQYNILPRWVLFGVGYQF
jgi:hypothetical protein